MGNCMRIVYTKKFIYIFWFNNLLHNYQSIASRFLTACSIHGLVLSKFRSSAGASGEKMRKLGGRKGRLVSWQSEYITGICVLWSTMYLALYIKCIATPIQNMLCNSAKHLLEIRKVAMYNEKNKNAAVLDSEKKHQILSHISRDTKFEVIPIWIINSINMFPKPFFSTNIPIATRAYFSVLTILQLPANWLYSFFFQKSTHLCISAQCSTTAYDSR